MIQLNHITFSVSNIQKAIIHYNIVFDTKPVAVGENLAYYNLDGIWFALNTEHLKRIKSYTHVAFTTDDFPSLEHRLKRNGIHNELGRKRHLEEKMSLYIRDEDLNLIEFHQGNLEERLSHYEKNRRDIVINRS